MNETWEDLQAKSKGPWHTAAPDKRSKVEAQDRSTNEIDNRTPNLDSTADADIALVFAETHADRLRYVPELKAWVVWDESKARWVQDIAGDVVGKYRLKLWMDAVANDKSAKAHSTAVANGSTPTEATGKAKAVESGLKSTKKLNAVWGQITSEPMLITSLRHFDADPWMLNTPEGALDLWTGEMLEPHPSVLCLKQTKVAPQDGDAPRWEKVLSDAFPDDEDTQAYVETSLALALVGDQAIQHFWMLSGEAGSGKGTIMNTVMQLLGTGETGYAMPVEAEFLMRQKGDKHPEQYARLKGKRLVVSSESDRKQAFDAARVKNLTGDDVITGRWMRGNSFSFRPTWKLFLMTNYRPRVDPEDGGFWRRFREIPFRHKPAEPITDLQNRLIDEEGPQILARLLVRLEAFLETGGTLTPTAVQCATLQNQAEQDTVAEFIDQVCEVVDDSDVYVVAVELHKAFVAWTKDNGYESMSAIEFGRRVTKVTDGAVRSAKKTVNGKTLTVRRGIRLVQEGVVY